MEQGVVVVGVKAEAHASELLADAFAAASERRRARRSARLEAADRIRRHHRLAYLGAGVEPALRPRGRSGSSPTGGRTTRAWRSRSVSSTTTPPPPCNAPRSTRTSLFSGGVPTAFPRRCTWGTPPSRASHSVMPGSHRSAGDGGGCLRGTRAGACGEHSQVSPWASQMGSATPRASPVRPEPVISRALALAAPRTGPQPPPGTYVPVPRDRRRCRRHGHPGHAGDMSSNMDVSGAIVVGLDGSLESALAVDWGCAQAHLEQRPLVLLHATGLALGPGPWSDPQAPAARHLVWQQLAAVRTGTDRSPCPEGRRTVGPARWFPADSLLDASAAASMMVLGARGAGGRRRSSTGPSPGRSPRRPPVRSSS